jgi:hypothetical protein
MSDWKDKNYSVVQNAVRHGKLKRPHQALCQQCGKPKALKHHDDYSKPMDVIYLCQKCHTERHNKVLGWGMGGRPKGKWMFNFAVLPVGGFVFIRRPQSVLSGYVNRYKTRQLPGSDFKSFTFKDGVIIFRTK